MSSQDNVFVGKGPDHIVRGLVSSQTAVGNIIADGQSAKYVKLGFKPAFIRLIKLSEAAESPTTDVLALEWNEGMYYKDSDGTLHWNKSVAVANSGTMSRVDNDPTDDDPKHSDFSGIYVDERGFYLGQDSDLQGTEGSPNLVAFIAMG